VAAATCLLIPLMQGDPARRTALIWMYSPLMKGRPESLARRDGRHLSHTFRLYPRLVLRPHLQSHRSCRHHHFLHHLHLHRTPFFNAENLKVVTHSMPSKREARRRMYSRRHLFFNFHLSRTCQRAACIQRACTGFQERTGLQQNTGCSPFASLRKSPPWKSWMCEEGRSSSPQTRSRSATLPKSWSLTSGAVYDVRNSTSPGRRPSCCSSSVLGVCQPSTA